MDLYLLYRKFNYQTRIQPISKQQILLTGTIPRQAKVQEAVYCTIYAFSLITGHRLCLTKAHNSNAYFFIKKYGILGFKILLNSTSCTLLIANSKYNFVHIKDITTTSIAATAKSFIFGLGDIKIYQEVDIQFDILFNKIGCHHSVFVGDNMIATCAVVLSLYQYPIICR